MLSGFTRIILEALELQVNEQYAQEPWNQALKSLVKALALEKRGFILEAATLYRTVAHPIALHRLQLIAFNPPQMPPASALTFLPNFAAQSNSPFLSSTAARSFSEISLQNVRNEVVLPPIVSVEDEVTEDKANTPNQSAAFIPYANKRRSKFEPADPLKLLNYINDVWQQCKRSPTINEMMGELDTSRHFIEKALGALNKKEWIEESRSWSLKVYTLTALGKKSLPNNLLKPQVRVQQNFIDLTASDSLPDSSEVVEKVKSSEPVVNNVPKPPLLLSALLPPVLAEPVETIPSVAERMSIAKLLN